MLPLWQFEARDVLWGLLPADGGRIIGEERDLGRKRTAFFCLDQSTGLILWRGRSYGEDWWTGMEAVAGEVLFLHGFATPSLPIHKGLVAVDVASGKQIWKAADFTFVRSSRDSVFVASGDARGATLHRLDARSGRVLESFQRDQERPELSEPEATVDAGVSAPLPLDSLSPVSSAARVALREAGGEGERPPEGICDNGYLVLAVRGAGGDGPEAKGSSGLDLFVINQANGKTKYRDRLHAGVEGSARPTFFVRNHLLLYVKDHRFLTAVPLDPEG